MGTVTDHHQDCSICERQAKAAADEPVYSDAYGEYVVTGEGTSRVMTVDGELVPWDGVVRYPKCVECHFPKGGGHADDCAHARPWQRSS
jgi:hypothetical protein